MSEVYYNENLYKWIDVMKLNSDEKEMCLKFIKAYSEFLVTINPDFKYNKTYLPAFFVDFINACNDINSLIDIVNTVKDYLNKSLGKIDTTDGILKVSINDILYFELAIPSINGNYNPGIHLTNQFSIYDIQKNKIKVWLKFNSSNGLNGVTRVYDIAKQTKKAENKDIVEKIMDDFICLIKEVI